MVYSPDGNIGFFEIIAGVLRVDKLAPFIYIIDLDYILRTSVDQVKENGFTLEETRWRRYST